MEARVYGVGGRGFEEPWPAAHAVVTNATQEAEGGREVNARRAVRDAVGDVYWELEEQVRWEPGEVIKVRVAGVGNVNVNMRDGQEGIDEQRWRTIGEKDNGLQVRLVVKNVPTAQAEAERARRLARLQRKQFELAMMRLVPPDMLLRWEQKREERAAVKIQRMWSGKTSQNKRKSARKRGEQQPTSKNIGKASASWSLDKTPGRDPWEEDNLQDDDEEEEEEYLDETKGERSEQASAAKGHGLEETDRKVDVLAPVSDDEIGDESTDSDLKRMVQLNDFIVKEAYQMMERSERHSTHERYQLLIEQGNAVNQRWESEFAPVQAPQMILREQERLHRLSELRETHQRLSNLQRPLSSYLQPAERAREGQELEENGGPAQDVDKQAVQIKQGKRLWRLPRDRSILQQAHLLHASSKEAVRHGNEWWRVRLGNEERDIRTMGKGHPPPWTHLPSADEDAFRLGAACGLSSCAYPTQKGIAEDVELSRWWISFASKDPSSADAVALGARADGAALEQLDETVEREKARIVLEVQQRLKANQSPLVNAILSCPPHRIHRLRHATAEKKTLHQQQRVPSFQDQQSLPSPKPVAHALSGGSPRASEGLGYASSVAAAAVGQEVPAKEASSGKKGGNKKGSKKKERALTHHIEALEEQIAILKAQAAHRELRALKQNIDSEKLSTSERWLEENASGAANNVR